MKQLLLSFLLLFSFATMAGTIVVTNGNDAGPGSLRQAIATAADLNVIQFTGVSTVTLTSGELIIGKHITIDGGAGVTITRSGTTAFRLLTVASGFAVTISNITFTNGSADLGGAIYNNSNYLLLERCTFSGNTASVMGGALYNNACSPKVANSLFINNVIAVAPPPCSAPTGLNVSGLPGTTLSFSWTPVPNATHYIVTLSFTSDGELFTFNHNAGNITSLNLSSLYTCTQYSWSVTAYCTSGSASSTQSTFLTTSVGCGGGSHGGIFTRKEYLSTEFAEMPNLHNSQSIIANITTTQNNLAENGGAAIANNGGSAQVINCTFYGNTANTGGTILNDATTNAVITNSIIWGNSAGGIVNTASPAAVTYSIVQGGYAGTGNLNADPLFVDAAAVNFQLQPCSPAVNTGNNDVDFNPPVLPDSCATPTGLATTGVTRDAATVSWTGVTGAAYYVITLNPGTITYNVGANTSFAITSLGSNTVYSWFVTAFCTSGASSPSTVSSFTTAVGGHGGIHDKNSERQVAIPQTSNNILATSATQTNNLIDPSTTDLAGNPRIVHNIIDMGAYEMQSGSCCTLITFYKDSDNDLYSDGTTQQACIQPSGYKLATDLTATTGDCNDAVYTINPGVTEVCDGIDNNCNGTTDEGFVNTDGDTQANCVDADDDNDGVADGDDCAPLDVTKWRSALLYIDTDGDGYHNSSATICYGATVPVGYVAGTLGLDNCPLVANPTQTDSDGDGLGDACDLILSCVGNRLVYTGTTSCNAVVNGIDAQILPVGAAVSYTLTGATTGSGTGSASGLTFNPGATIVTYTSVDEPSKTCSFIITVQDNVKPIVITQNITVQLNAAGTATITENAVNNGSSDACGGLTFDTDVTSFNCSNVGANTVTLTVTDANNNSHFATAIVTVEDKVKPTVITKNITVQLNAAGTVTIAEDAVNNGSSDACGGLTFDTDVTTFDCTDVGTNTVMIRVIDVNNNSSFATATVTVEDKVKPAVVTKNITVQLNAAGTATITEDAVNNGSSDACGGLTFDTDLTSFNCSNVGANTVTLTVTDANNNTHSATAIVTVEDKVKPTAVTKNITVQLNAAGTVTIAEDAVNNGSSDACGGLTFDTDVTSFTCSSVGANTVTLTVTDAVGNASTATAVVTVEDKIKPVAACKNIEVYLGLNGLVSITPQQIDNGSTDACGITLTISKSQFDVTNAGANNVVLTATDATGNFHTCTAVVTVKKRPTTLVYTDDGSEQYSDQQVLTAILTDAITGDVLANKTVSFTIGAQSKAGSTNAAGVVNELLILTQNPALNYTVASNFAGDALYQPSSDNDVFDITQENARVDYTGVQFIATPCATCASAVVQLRATVLDISVPMMPADPLYDPFAGDIRKAKVKFVNRDNNTDISGWINVSTLINPADFRIGTVTFPYTVSLTSSETGKLITVGIIVDNGYYIRNNPFDNTVITVYKPVTEFITGGGHIIPTQSSGLYASDAGVKSNFGVNVKYNRNGSQPKGNVNIIFRRTVNGVLRTFQIKSNSIESLGIGGTNAHKKGQFISKANLTDITNPLATVSLGGNLDLNVTMTDKGEPGNQDSIGITLYGSNGSLWYSSNWVVSRTVELQLAAGNIVIKGANVGSAARGESATGSEEEVTEPIITKADPTTLIHMPLAVIVYPSPSTSQFTLRFTSSQNEKVTLKVSDASGRIIESRTNLDPKSNVVIGSTYTPGTYFVEVRQGNERKQITLIKL